MVSSKLAQAMLAFEAVLILTLAAIPSRAEVPVQREREALLSGLSQTLLAKGGPLPLGEGRGWRGVVLAAPGTTLSPITTAFDSQGNETQNISQLLEMVNLYDRVMVIEDGVGHFGTRSVSEVWEGVLNRTMPTTTLPIQPADNDESAKWLFRSADKIDKARGIRYDREPSVYMIRFREYELLYQMLTLAESKDDGAWRLHPKLSQFTTIKEARSSVAEDWIKYGYKVEVEAAQQVFRKRANAEPWTYWTDAKSRFEADRVAIDTTRSVHRTFLFPSPNVWLNMGSWVRFVTHTADGKSATRCQLARVRVIRPWLSIEDLLDGKLKLDPALPENKGFMLSDGAAPTLTSVPKGNLSAYVEELIIVRDIRFDTPEAQRALHPLSIFAYPEATNLLGYIVRILPKYPQ